MTPTGIEFIDDLRQEWSAGNVTRDDALERLLPWEDNLATRTQQELEAAWALRQEIESGGTAASHPDQPPEASTASGSPAGQAEQAPDAELQHMQADLRANPLLSLHDIAAARALCARLGEAGSAPDDEYVRARCAEVEEKAKSHVEAIQREVEEATQVLQESPDIEEKLRACDRLREGLGDIEMMHPDDPTLPDMVAWCEQTRQELLTLLAERDLLLADVASLTASGAEGHLDIGLVESTKQRLIVMSDTPLAKDDTGFRQAAKNLSAKLNEYLSTRFKSGTTPDKQVVAEYEEVLRLAKQAPETIDAGKAKSYGDLLAEAHAELARIERGSEPPARSIPSTPPPQPKSTAGSQPSAAVIPDGVPQLQPHPAPPTQPGPGSTRPLPPPPPPRVQPGMASITSVTQPVTQPGTAPTHGSSMTVPPPGTGGLSSYPQPPGSAYAPSAGGLSLSPAAWAGIAVGIIAFILVAVVVVILATSRSGGTNTNTNPINPGGSTGARSVAENFFTNVSARRFDAAAAFVAPEISNQNEATTLQQWVMDNEALANGTLASVEVGTVNETGNSATANFTFIFNSAQGRVGLDGQISLKKEGNNWLVSDY